jgi:HEPN domain-containing protein
LEDLCYNAHQAAEKCIKGLLIYRGVRFPYIHDLNELLLLLDQGGEMVPDEIWATKVLTEYAVEARYPGVGEPVTHEEYKEAVSLAERVIQWAESCLARKAV